MSYSVIFDLILLRKLTTMKQLFFSFLLSSIFSFSVAQSGYSQVTKDSLSVSKTIGINQLAEFDGIEVKFKKVISDSRCPKAVLCVRAGEAFVEVAVYKNKKFIKNQTLRINASGVVIEPTNLVFSTKAFKIYGFSLLPYPDGTGNTEQDAYQLELMYQPLMVK